jgi:hypothetical protein
MSTETVTPAPRKRTRRLAGDRSAKAIIFAAAFLSFLLSVWLWFSGDRERGLFVGLWVPSICSAGALLLAGRRHE